MGRSPGTFCGVLVFIVSGIPRQAQSAWYSSNVSQLAGHVLIPDVIFSRPCLRPPRASIHVICSGYLSGQSENLYFRIKRMPHSEFLVSCAGPERCHEILV